MAFKKTNLNDIFRGDTKVFKFTFDDGAVTPTAIDITNWTIWMTLKTNLSDLDGPAPIQIESTAGDHVNDDIPNGVMYLTLTSVQTSALTPGKYEYDFQRVIEGTSPLEVRTLAQGKVKILEDVTVSVAVDTVPDAFSFTDQTDVVVDTEITSKAITIYGINFPTAITIAGDSTSYYSINGADYVNTPATVDYGDTVTIKHQSSASATTAIDSILTIGGISDTFTSTTA